ncbi:hypothetical protein DMA11_17475 [Marinilabiliaceae bacterium JC017]|nr:hypothetical protein DMA11_17475 [Marinilabiliaceae bacterium JC017]
MLFFTFANGVSSYIVRIEIIIIEIMKYTGRLWFVVGVVLIVACSPLKKIEVQKRSADNAYEISNFSTALVEYLSLIDLYKASSVEVPFDVYLKAGNSATQEGKMDQARLLYTHAIDLSKSKAPMEGLLKTYNEAGDLNELEAVVEKYSSRLKEVGLYDIAFSQVFDLARSQNDFLKALDVFEKIENPTKDIKGKYIVVLDKLGEEKKALEYSKKELGLDGEFIPALEWLGKYDYNRAEKWYKSEMTKYNKKKDYTQYVYLKRELKKISNIYRSARDKFEKLHALDPENTSYIKYLKNCYLRLELKDKAAAMDKLLQK